MSNLSLPSHWEKALGGRARNSAEMENPCRASTARGFGADGATHDWLHSVSSKPSEPCGDPGRGAVDPLRPPEPQDPGSGAHQRAGSLATPPHRSFPLPCPLVKGLLSETRPKRKDFFGFLTCGDTASPGWAGKAAGSPVVADTCGLLFPMKSWPGLCGDICL